MLLDACFQHFKVTNNVLWIPICFICIYIFFITNISFAINYRHKIETKI